MGISRDLIELVHRVNRHPSECVFLERNDQFPQRNYVCLLADEFHLGPQWIENTIHLNRLSLDTPKLYTPQNCFCVDHQDVFKHRSFFMTEALIYGN